jgi:hypothetical protein
MPPSTPREEGETQTPKRAGQTDQEEQHKQQPSAYNQAREANPRRQHTNSLAHHSIQRHTYFPNLLHQIPIPMLVNEHQPSPTPSRKNQAEKDPRRTRQEYNRGK